MTCRLCRGTISAHIKNSQLHREHVWNHDDEPLLLLLLAQKLLIVKSRLPTQCMRTQFANEYSHNMPHRPRTWKKSIVYLPSLLVRYAASDKKKRRRTLECYAVKQLVALSRARSEMCSLLLCGRGSQFSCSRTNAATFRVKRKVRFYMHFAMCAVCGGECGEFDFVLFRFSFAVLDIPIALANYEFDAPFSRNINRVRPEIRRSTFMATGMNNEILKKTKI